MRRVLVLSLVLGLCTLPGCFLSREFSTCGEDAGETAAMLGDALEFDVAYFGDLTKNTTRSEESPGEWMVAADEMWQELFLEQRPAAPLSMPAVSAPVRGTISVEKEASAAPPARTEVERTPGSDVVIIRDPDGKVYITNRPDKARKSK